MEEFYIDEQCLSDIVVKRYTSGLVLDKENPTIENVADILKGKHDSYSLSIIDHPEFTKLREKLEESGYIHVVRTYNNGDTVLKPFKLNGFSFEKEDRFLCASALGMHFRVMKKAK